MPHKPTCIGLTVIVFGNIVNIGLAFLIIGCGLGLPVPVLSSETSSALVFYGAGEDIACEPRLVPITGGITAHHCDLSVRCVSPTLCIGNEHSARNYEALHQAGVTHIISAINSCSERRDKHRPCLNLNLADTANELGIIAALREAREWRREQRESICSTSGTCAPATEEPHIFVHCAAGVSRSATLTIGFMLEDDPARTYDSALAELRKARSVVRPNPLFELALRFVQQLGTGPEAECALGTALSTQPSECNCAAATCQLVESILAEHRNLLILQLAMS